LPGPPHTIINAEGAYEVLGFKGGRWKPPAAPRAASVVAPCVVCDGDTPAYTREQYVRRCALVLVMVPYC
jgi:hypothetical protein